MTTATTRPPPQIDVVESPAERRRIGAESRAYVEQVHDIERVTDRLLDLYARL